MNSYRQGEQGSNRLRSSRFIYKDGEWYARTRENIDLGPFESHAEAAVCLDQYLAFVQGASPEDKEQFFKMYAAA